MVQDGVGISGVAGLDGGLRGKIVGEIGEGFAAVLGQGGAGDCFGVAMVLHIGVAKGEIGRGCRFTGMGVRVGEDSGVGGGRARGGKLLGPWNACAEARKALVSLMLRGVGGL